MRYPSGAGPSVCPPRVGRCVCAEVEKVGAEQRAAVKRETAGRERASAVNARGDAIMSVVREEWRGGEGGDVKMEALWSPLHCFTKNHSQS